VRHQRAGREARGLLRRMQERRGLVDLHEGTWHRRGALHARRAVTAPERHGENCGMSDSHQVVLPPTMRRM
jgi:hypothetical protein